MLSTQYRLRLEAICERIVKGESVELSDMIWAEKLAKANRSAATILRQARRRAANPDMTEDSLDGFMNALDLEILIHQIIELDLMVLMILLISSLEINQILETKRLMKSFQEFYLKKRSLQKKLQVILTNQKEMRSAPTVICGDHQMLVLL
jgi:hypothetical protein